MLKVFHSGPGRCLPLVEDLSYLLGKPEVFRLKGLNLAAGSRARVLANPLKTHDIYLTVRHRVACENLSSEASRTKLSPEKAIYMSEPHE
jgi:hypothetical protein